MTTAPGSVQTTKQATTNLRSVSPHSGGTPAVSGMIVLSLHRYATLHAAIPGSLQMHEIDEKLQISLVCGYVVAESLS